MEGAAPAAPAEAPPAETPANGAPPAENAPPKPRTIDDDLEDVLKKHGGFEYTKGKKIDNAANLKRMLGRVTGVDAAASEAVKVKQAAAEQKAKIDGLAKMKPGERLKALEEMGFPKKLIMEALEEDVLSWDAKQKQQAGMSEREKQLAADLEARDSELADFRRQQDEAKTAREQEEYIARQTEIGQRLESVTVAALQRAKISPEQSPQYLHAIAERLDRNERLGLGLDEAELADVVLKEQETQATGFLKGKSAPDLADLLEAMGPTVVKPLLEEFAKRIRAKKHGAFDQVAAGQPARHHEPAENQGDDRAAKLKFWRGR